MITKPHSFRLKCAIAMVTALFLSFIASRSNAQSNPQTTLYISDGSGHLTALTAPSGPSTIIFPAGGGTLLTATTGLTNPMTTLGDMIYGIAGGVLTRLPGNSTGSTKEFLTSSSALGVAAAPAWATIAAADVPTFIKSGGTHAAGAVPDPGSTSGTTRFLREDATWAAPSGGSSAMMISGFSTFSGYGPYYVYPVGSTGTPTTTTADVADGDVMVVNRNGTLKNFTVSISAVPSSGTTYKFTIYKGSTTTGITLTFSSATAATQTDATDTYSISSGDLLSIKYVGTGTSPSVYATWAFDIQ